MSEAHYFFMLNDLAQLIDEFGASKVVRDLIEYKPAQAKLLYLALQEEFYREKEVF